MTTGIKIYITFVAFAALALLGLMFSLEPKMIIPSLLGACIFTGIIVLQMKYMSQKSYDDQKRITVRNGRVASVLVVVMLIGLFYAASEYHNIPLMQFIKLWFGI